MPKWLSPALLLCFTLLSVQFCPAQEPAQKDSQSVAVEEPPADDAGDPGPIAVAAPIAAVAADPAPDLPVTPAPETMTK